MAVIFICTSIFFNEFQEWVEREKCYCIFVTLKKCKVIFTFIQTILINPPAHLKYPEADSDEKVSEDAADTSSPSLKVTIRTPSDVDDNADDAKHLLRLNMAKIWWIITEVLPYLTYMLGSRSPWTRQRRFVWMTCQTALTGTKNGSAKDWLWRGTR